MAELLQTMEPMILKAGCSMKRVELKDAKYEEVESGYRWLVNVFETEYEEVRKVRALISEELWASYDLLDPEDFQESRLLVEALTHLRKRINRDRPDYFKRKKNVKKKSRKSEQPDCENQGA